MTYIFYIFLFFVLGSNRVRAQVSHTNAIKTESGIVVGEYLKTITRSTTYASFRGIPYAEAPVGALRLQPPVPKRPWTGTLNATSDANMCIQMNDKKIVVGSEDCLYLNVYTPQMPGSKTTLLPVAVWIHGGAFTTGNGNSTYFGPDFLLEENVVVVSIQYRLGPLGFLNINHPSVVGNCGLRDQNLALKWVQNNIHLFSGDRRRVTLIGQSAGSVSVDLHKLSDMSTGLFRQTISMSGSALCLYWGFQAQAEAEAQAFKLGSHLGLKSKDKSQLLKLLLNTPAKRIIEQAAKLPLIPFRPSIESFPDKRPKFISECTPKRYEEGRYNKGPELMGFTKNEILEFAKVLDDIIDFTTIGTKIIKDIPVISSLKVLPKILTLPTKGITALEKADFQILIQELSDLFFYTGIDKKQQLVSKHNGHPIYYYKYTFESQYSAHKSQGIEYLKGVGHEDELPMIFYRPHLRIPLNDPGIAKTRARLTKLWTNFVKYGNPTPNGANDKLLGVTWPDSTDLKKTQYLEIGQDLKVKNGRPTNILVKMYQSVGLGDSKILNDCVKNVANAIVKGVVGLPGRIINAVTHPGKTVGKLLG